ncbi:MAG: T9SS type A sorting domain-containing protein [Saprospiraceae bacterium]
MRKYLLQLTIILSCSTFIEAQLKLTCPANKTEPACQTQAAVDTAFANWKATASISGGCNAVLSNNGGTAPNKCGGSTTITFTAKSDCDSTLTCTATFTVSSPPPVVLTCPAPKTEAACQTQAAINASFPAWLATTTGSGGCSGVLTNNNTGALNACGGSVTVTFTYTSTCAPFTTTCNATFTVSSAPAVALTCPAPKTEAACQTQAAINASFATWKNTASFTGGCNGVLTNSGGTAPNACGGSTTVTFTVTSTCAPLITTCTATFTVNPAPAVVLICPNSQTEAACQTQKTIDIKFETWKKSIKVSGGCNTIVSDNGINAPSACGGSISVTFTVKSDCELSISCISTFSVASAPVVVLSCPQSVTEDSNQTQQKIDEKFKAWLESTSFSGGCNSVLSNSGGKPPPATGGFTTVTFTVTSSCQAPVNCTATFTVKGANAVKNYSDFNGQFIIFPNPTSKVNINIESVLDYSHNYKLEIYSLLGIKFLNQSILSGIHKITLDKINQEGIYLVRLLQDNRTVYSDKLVITN